MSSKQNPFFYADGSINYAKALSAGISARSKAVRRVFGAGRRLALSGFKRVLSMAQRMGLESKNTR